MAKILIVDDELQLRQSFQRLLAGEGHDVRAASTGEQGLKLVREELPDLVIMDVRMPGMDGLTALRAMREIDARLPVVIMTAYSTTETAIEATKMGAFDYIDYILKPFEIPDILALIEQAVEAGRRMRARVDMMADGADGEGGGQDPLGEALVGAGRAMHQVYKAIGRAAPTDALVLVRGESGTGKELVARAVYQHSLRGQKPFLVINCVAIPRVPAQPARQKAVPGHQLRGHSGHPAGKRTVRLREGGLHRGHQPPGGQDRAGGRRHRVPGRNRRHAAGHPGQAAAPVAGKADRTAGRPPAHTRGRAHHRGFREDLYYRLKVVTLWLPPLRERSEDIPPLARYFLARFSREMDMPNPGITPEALAYLEAQPWPGNVRELGNTIQKALVFSRGGPLGEPDLKQALEASRGIRPGSEGPACDLSLAADQTMQELIRRTLSESDGDNVFDALMDHVGRLVVREALHLTGGNRTRAARLLGLSRPTLLAKIEKYGLRIETQVS